MFDLHLFLVQNERRIMSRILFWFRRDLRTVDNVGLHRAAESGTVLPVFIVDPSHKNWPHRCGDRFQFKMNAVASLRETLRDGGGELYVRTGPADDVFPHLADRTGAEAVFWNRSYEPYELERDADVRSALEQRGIDVRTFKDQVVFEEDEILTKKGTPYQVFTYYARSWKQKEKPSTVSSVECDPWPGDLEPGPLPSAGDMGLERNVDELQWQGSREAALDRFRTFLDESIADYDTNRDHPARDATSKMSPHLRFGLVSVRELYETVRERFDPDQNDGADTYVEELIWRDFYHQILYHHPHVVERDFRDTYEDLEWASHPEWFDAWKAGKTGFPIVDAAMRQLNQTGWMHNRLRMIVAQFLTKHCLIHWQKGEAYFMNRLIDGDTAANNGGWQWSSSTGTDAAPYFRMFNPVSQSRKCDPNGTFIRSFCPELAGLPDDLIHAPFEADPDRLAEAGVVPGDTYPEPLFDHQERRDHALEVFAAAREEA